MTRAPTSPRIPSLDGLRAISILMVVIGHIIQMSGVSGPFPLNYLLGMIGHRMLGVSIFFGISGFLITRLLVEETKRTGRIHLGQFYLRRAFRILPAYLTYIAFIALLLVAGQITMKPGQFLYALTFTWNYAKPAEAWWLAHTWSLSVEEQFYILWPTTLFFLGSRKATRLATGLILASPLIRILFYVICPSWRDRISILLHTRLDALMFGCLLALLYDDEKARTFLRKILNPKWHWPIFGFLFCVSPFLIAQLRGKYLLPVGYTFESAAIALLVYWAIESAATPVGRLLNSRVMVHVGVLSYSLYLWQQVFITDSPWTRAATFPLNALAILCAAHLSYYFVEKPFLSLRRKHLP